MTIESSIDLGNTYSWQSIAAIDNTYMALGGNLHAGVFNLDTMSMVDIISINDNLPLGNTAYATKELVVINS